MTQRITKATGETTYFINCAGDGEDSSDGEDHEETEIPSEGCYMEDAVDSGDDISDSGC